MAAKEPTGRLRKFAVPDVETEGSFEGLIAQVAAAIAVTRGPEHVIAWANPAFQALIARETRPMIGRPIAEMFQERDGVAVSDILDGARNSGVVVRDCRVGPLDADLPLCCTVWPEMGPTGQVGRMVVEFRPSTSGELALAIQLEVAERLLLSALREQEAAAVAEVLRRSAAFLASESRRLSESLDEDTTLAAMAGMSLAHLGDWCIVDTLGPNKTMHRLSIVHPNPAHQELLDVVNGRWAPLPADPFGLPTVLKEARTSIVDHDIDAALAGAAHDPALSAALHTLGVRGMLTVPLKVRERLLGAVTFVRSSESQPFSPDDIDLAEDIASRSAVALDRARAYGEALALKVRAEAATLAKSEFLGMMSHELRTPLNAIGGYVDLMDMELHGPLTEAQRVDLARIRSNQRYLMGLIRDLLNFTKLGGGKIEYHVGDIDIFDALSGGVAMVAPLVEQKALVLAAIPRDDRVRARGDAEKVTQILVNLLSNAIKFTPTGGTIALDYRADEGSVLVSVEDNGIGIPADKLEVIFDPFVQVKGNRTTVEGGVGLGLAISRGLARGMEGDLTVESTLGEGARFTLRLPRSLTGVQV